MVLLFYLCCFLQTKLWTWVISIYFSVSLVWSGDCEREGFALTCLAPCLALNLIRSHPHRKRFFYWGMLWFVLCFPHLQHLERAFASIPPFSWTTRNDSTHDLCFFHSKKSWLSKTKGSSLRRSWWFEDTPKLRLGKQGLYMWIWVWWWVPVPCCGPNCNLLLLLSTWAHCAVLRKVVEKSGIETEQCTHLLTWVSKIGMVTMTGTPYWAIAFVLCWESNKNLVYVLGTVQRT